MIPTPANTKAGSRKWIVLSLLLAITIINFIDRQTLSVLAPKIRETFHLSHSAYGWIVAAFQFGMTIGEFPMGWLMDRWGVRLGFTVAVLWWSAATGLHAFARSGLHFGIFRFWMGTGECGNFSGGIKTVNKWFSREDRALGIGIFNSGSMIGSILAPPLIVFLATSFGYKIAFLVPATLGIIWVIVWRFFYREPESETHTETAPVISNTSLLRRRQAWAIMLCRFFVGPIMQFYWYWMPDYLYTVRGLSLMAIGAFSWIPFLMGDLGSLSGGWIAGLLMRRGFSLLRARQITMYFGAICCLASFFVVRVPHAGQALAVIGLVLFGHTFLSANMFAAVGDLFPDRAVGRATGLTGISGGISGLLFPLITGFLVDHFSYTPVFFLAAIMPLIGVILLFFVSHGLQPVSDHDLSDNAL